MANAIRRALAWSRVPVNTIGYALRAGLRWSGGEVALRDEAKGDLFAGWPEPLRSSCARRAAVLAQRYDLAALRARSSRAVYRDNLALLDQLERLVPAGSLPDPGTGPLLATDVGSADFAVATALQRFAAHHGVAAPRAVQLRGIEIDGHGIYRDGHARCDHARAHAALAGSGVSYQVADFGRVALPPQHLVTLLHPFVDAYPLLQWGLPLHHFGPRRLLAAAATALQPGGLLVVMSQTTAEAARLCRLVRGLPLRRLRRCRLGSDLVDYRERVSGRVGTLLRRT